MKSKFGREKSKVRRVFPFLTGKTKLPTEEFTIFFVGVVHLHSASALALATRPDAECGKVANFALRNVLSTDLSMNPWLTVALLVVSNVFMTFAWYGHIKLEQMRVITDHTPLYLVILLSWCLALFEYSFQIPANRYGYVGNGGAFSLMQLKVIQEVVSITVFTLFSVIFFRGEPLQWNHLAAFACLVLAVYFVFLK